MVRVVADLDRVARVEVAHDDSCPWWRARGARRFTEIRIKVGR